MAKEGISQLSSVEEKALVLPQGLVRLIMCEMGILTLLVSRLDPEAMNLWALRSDHEPRAQEYEVRYLTAQLNHPSFHV